MSVLSGVRVLDLADESGVFCGKLLADLGAEVVRVEARPPNAMSRLFDLHYNGGKRVVGADVDAARFDVVIVTGTPSQCAARGLDYATLSAREPRLIVVAISPFGQTGPYAAWRSCDLVAQAMGGMAFVNGHPHEPPLRGFGLQAYHSAGFHGAIGALLALLARERTRRGQLVDISLQEAVAATVEHVSGSYHLNGTIERRRGSLHWTRAFRVGRARDGYVMQTTLGDWESLVAWVKSEIDAGDLDDPRFETFTTRQREHQHIFDVLDTWIRGHNVDELIESAQLRRIPFAAVRPLAALVDDAQLRARGFVVRDPNSALKRPGPPFRMRIENTEHRTQSTDDRGNPGLGSVSEAVCALSAQRSLSGVRVLDFTWVVAGPVATRVLADHGADVIKIERRDATDFGSRRGGLTGNLNRGKRSIMINMADPRGVALARELVRCSDVVIDNFSSRVMCNWELDYAHLRALKPDIIAVSMSGFGHTGPHANHVSYGPTLQALAGFSHQMRHAGGEPAGWGYSYADMIGGYSGALAVLTALWHRAETGQGQHIDLSQFEALVSAIGVPLVELLNTGAFTAPLGNRSMERAAAPHGIYRCKEEEPPLASPPLPESATGATYTDRWCAIAVFGDDDWARFVDAIGAPAWTADPRFATAAGRELHQNALDDLVNAWTEPQLAEDVMRRLQEAGIAAGVVADARDLCARDPQLAARGYWKTLSTPEGDAVTVDGVAAKLSDTPGRVASPAPLLGEHTDAILREMLRLSEIDIDGLRRDGVVA